MIKNKKFKIFISFLLVFSIIFSYIPFSMLSTVFANLQSNVRNLKISSEDKQSGYGINLSWENPPWSTAPDSGATGGDTMHQPEGFKIYQKSSKSSDSTEKEIKNEQGADVKNSKLDNLALEDGHIYEYKVKPYHKHNYPGANNNPTQNDAPMDPNTPEESVLFMTDLKVEAYGAGKTLHVTFDNPKYNNRDIFTAYKIYYQKGGPGVTAFNSDITVSLDNSELIKTYDAAREVNRLTYSIVDDAIQPGNIYAVKVEPIFNGNEIRDTAKTPNPYVYIDDNKTIKKISFSSKVSREYRTNDAAVSISLSILEDGKEFLKLKWGDLSSTATVGNIEYIGIYSGENNEEISNVISKIYSQDAIKVNSWRVNRPTRKTYYQLKVKLKDIDSHVLSDTVFYDPLSVNITPNKPVVFPKIQIEGNKSILDIYWEAFIRPPYNYVESETAGNSGLIIDKDVLYDIWITDSRKNLSVIGLPKVLDRVKADTLEPTNIEETNKQVYKLPVKKYFTVDSNGAFLEKEIEENKTYYIKVLAIKPIPDSVGLTSEPAETQIYIPARGDISKPNSLSKPPLRIKKDQLGVDMIKQEELTIEWSRKWFEVYDEVTETWHSNAALKNGKLIFGKEITPEDEVIKFYDASSIDDVKRIFTQAGYTETDKLLIRHIDISQDNIKYELITKPFDEINNAGGYEAFIEKLLNGETSEWQEINPNFTGDNLADHKITGLTANTRYAVLLRPYRLLPDGRKDAYPTYLLVTTLPVGGEIEIKPVIPVLQEVSKTDITIDISWKVIPKETRYELAVNEVLLDDPGKSKIIIGADEIIKNGKEFTKDEQGYIQYQIKNLFPDTGYYIWIRTLSSTSDQKSDWSNPLYIRTEGVRKPEPPAGVGLASEKALSIYNTKNKTDLKPATGNYLIIEWLRDSNDTIEEAKAKENGTAEPLLDPDIKRTYMVKFNKLLANRRYYIRAKTKVYVSKTSEGKVEKLYSYIIQLSEKKDFKDVVEIEVPDIKPSGDKVLTAESDWTEPLRFTTRKADGSEGDYDGGVDNEVYPLPTEDFEIFYDGVTQELVYRFRSNKKDGNGNKDNLVDQRFITKLINDKVFNYKIDLTSHLGYKIKSRKVELPYSIVSAFDDRKISLSLLINGTTFKLNPGFVKSNDINNKSTLGANTAVHIEAIENSPKTPIITINQGYTSEPQEFKVSVIKGDGTKTTLNQLGSDMNIDIKLINRGEVLNKNVSIYKSNNQTNGWEKVNSIYNNEKGTMAVKTRETGIYSTISNTLKGAESNESVNSVNSKIMLKDLITDNLNTPISTVQFNNILAGIANNKTAISVNTALSTQDYNSLKRSGMLLNGSVVGKEAGINSLVKLYELKTKSTYTPSTNINTTNLSDIRSVNKDYQNTFIKAAELGFFENSNSSNPKSTMTLQEVLNIANIILDDSGY